MQAKEPTERLVRLFEQELRTLQESPITTTEPRRTRRVSRDLERQVVEFVTHEQKEGRSPEQMLVQLKSLLGKAAPDVPGSERSALIATLTGRAINIFFGSPGSRRVDP